MQFTDFSKLDLGRLPTPCYVVDEVAIERNLKLLKEIEQRSGAKILHALKAFSLWDLAPLTNQYLSGTCSSGLHEAKLAQDYYEGEVHVFSTAFSESDLSELLTFADHIVFNSCSQLYRFKDLCWQVKKARPALTFGLRINPEHSEGAVSLYDPCSKGSRLGVTRSQLDKYLRMQDFNDAYALLSGFHFHTLCEQGFHPLQRTLDAVEEQFSDLLLKMDWVNFGGGHHLTHPDYEVEELIGCVQQYKAKYSVDVYLEPGEAIAIGTGVLVSEILDISFNEISQAILDTSATCHMPDVLEMPYRPDVFNEVQESPDAYRYRFGGLTCLAGDVIGDYSFSRPLKIGDRLIFEDMAHYTMVKTSTFNGTKLPAIAIWNSNTNQLKVVREFGYNDFVMRLS